MSAPATVVLLPVKPLALGKSRLTQLPEAHRRDLAEAFARDTIAAALATPAVTAVLVVTDDHTFAADLAGEGCSVIPDGVSDDLNGTLLQAAREAGRRWPGCRVAALCADLPALSPTDLAAALDATDHGDGPAYVRDVEGSGTTMYVAAEADFVPRFGPGSAAAHEADGAREIAGDLRTLRQDVDHVGDLSHALLLGVGPHTAAATGRRT